MTPSNGRFLDWMVDTPPGAFLPSNRSLFKPGTPEKIIKEYEIYLDAATRIRRGESSSVPDDVPRAVLEECVKKVKEYKQRFDEQFPTGMASNGFDTMLNALRQCLKVGKPMRWKTRGELIVSYDVPQSTF